MRLTDIIALAALAVSGCSFTPPANGPDVMFKGTIASGHPVTVSEMRPNGVVILPAWCEDIGGRIYERCRETYLHEWRHVEAGPWHGVTVGLEKSPAQVARQSALDACTAAAGLPLSRPPVDNSVCTHETPCVPGGHAPAGYAVQESWLELADIQPGTAEWNAYGACLLSAIERTPL